jgi:exodeoxyribonuclease VII small subunit
MAARKKKSEEPKYGELAKELDEILASIEEGEVDIDDLTERAARATELIKLCREKLEATQIEVKKVVAALDEADEEETEEEWEEEDEDEEEDGDEEAPF